MKSAGNFEFPRGGRIAGRVIGALALASLLGLTLTTPAYAYIDPGSAAIVTQLVIGFFAAASAYIGHKFKLFQRLFSGKKRNEPRANREDDDT